MMDELDRNIINRLQLDFPVCDHPFAVVADQLGTSETELISRIERLLDDNYLTRFGPLYDAVKFDGALSLCAMTVPEERFEAVAEKVNAYSQVAHNYQRDHQLNMWFVLATETQDDLDKTLIAIEADTGLPVRNMPKLQEFYVGLYFKV